MRFVDRFGNEIDCCISFDTNTGIAVVYEPLIKRAQEIGSILVYEEDFIRLTL